MAAPLESLLERLNAGDESAISELFEQHTPYLRVVISRYLSGRLRAKFDTADVLQSVWVDLVRGIRERSWRFETAEQLRHFLTTITRNRFLNRIRHLRRSLETETSLPQSAEQSPVCEEPHPSEIAQANDLWQRLLQTCPPEYHSLLRLRRDGLSPEEIGQHVGMHPGSVRRILSSLARRLASRERVQP
jgi:RNA polymerase sigma-70 factor (ECF subfamily)